MPQINAAGEKIFSIMISIGYWTVLIAGVGQIIASVTRRDAQGALRQALVYGTSFGSLFALRWILDLVKEIFA
jgi:hypothetical protein